MPAPNDLTPEEEALFGQHGVPPAGPGSEPVIENAGDIQNQGQQPEPVQQPEPTQHGDREPQPQIEVSRHRADGTFKTQAEFEADMAEAIKASQGQQPQPEGQGQQPQPEGQGQQPDARTVPLAALHESRQREAAARQQNTLLMTRMNALLAQRGQGQPQEVQMPNIQDDPAGYIQALEARVANFERERQEENQYRELDDAISQDEALFSTMVPDYEQASDYYVQSRARELLAFHTPDEAKRILTQEARAIAQQSWERGLSLGQTVYGLAQARGYQPGNTAADPTKNPIPPGSVPQSQAQPSQNGPTATAIIDGVKAGQAASRSLSGGVGAGTTVLNAEAILAMNDDEFEKHFGLGTKGANERFATVG